MRKIFMMIICLSVLAIGATAFAVEEYTGSRDPQTPKPSGAGIYTDTYGNTYRREKVVGDPSCTNCYRNIQIKRWRPKETHYNLNLDDGGEIKHYDNSWDTDTYGTEKYNPASPSYQDPNGPFGTEIQKKKRPSQDWKKSARQIESEKEAARRADIERAIWESNHPGSAFCFINSLMD